MSTSAKGYIPVKAKNDPVPSSYMQDVGRIRKVLSKYGYLTTAAADAFQIWTNVSESYAAGWMNLPEDDFMLFTWMQPYFEPIFGD